MLVGPERGQRLPRWRVELEDGIGCSFPSPSPRALRAQEVAPISTDTLSREIFDLLLLRVIMDTHERYSSVLPLVDVQVFSLPPS